MIKELIKQGYSVKDSCNSVGLSRSSYYSSTCKNLEYQLPVSCQEIFKEFNLLSGHPWEETAKSDTTTYYPCLYGIVQKENPRKLLEIGTAFGLSSATLLKASPNLELFISIDLGIYGEQLGFSYNNLDFARCRIYAWCHKKNISTNKVRFYRANTQPPGKGDNENAGIDIPRWYQIPELVRLLQANEFDVIFIDGKHTEDGLLNDLKTFWPFLKPGGIVICDDLHEREEYKDIFIWAGDTVASFNTFLEENKKDIIDHFVWNYPQVPPGGKSGLRPFGLIRKKPLEHKISGTPGFEVFDHPDAIRINIARQDHFTSLGLDLYKKSVLEVGAGVGWHTAFFEKLSCSILSTDARPENVGEHRRRYPHRRVEIADLSIPGSHEKFGEFDVVYCYGTLYHLKDPALCIKELSKICKELFLLETCVNPVDNGKINLIEKDKNTPNQSCEGIGCSSVRDWIMSELSKYFPHVYITVYQPDLPDFPLNWPSDVTHGKLTRCVFVASRHPHMLPTLSPKLLDNQKRIESTIDYIGIYFNLDKDGLIVLPPGVKRVWIDVGAHEAETTFPYLCNVDDLAVIAIEPLIEKYELLTTKHPRLLVLPVAVSSTEGNAIFYRTANNVSSSLRPFNPDGLAIWKNKKGLEIIEERIVPTIRLERIIERLPVNTVEFLKIDTQGNDLDVIRSAGRQLDRIAKIKLEVAVTPEQLYKDAPKKDEVISYMLRHGFGLIDVEPQTDGQEENLTFLNLGNRESISIPLNEMTEETYHTASQFTPAKAYWNQRFKLRSLRDRIFCLVDAVDRKPDLWPYQWAQLMAAALEFKPDLILELGRGRGNSTCAFTEVANQLRNEGIDCNVVSLCISDDWENLTQWRVLQVVDEEWFRPLKALKGNILTFDYNALLKGVKKCLLFWDAHGFDVAECVLGGILPRIADIPHLVVMHDISDARYLPAENSLYGNNQLWRGNNWTGPRIRLGYIDSAVEQAVAIVDFTSRNNIPIDSADHSFDVEIVRNPAKLKEMQEVLGTDLFSTAAHWFWFTLNGVHRISYPRFDAPVNNNFRVINIFEAVQIMGVSLRNAVIAQPHLKDIIPRINRYLKEGKIRLAVKMIEIELGHLKESIEILRKLRAICMQEVKRWVQE